MMGDRFSCRLDLGESFDRCYSSFSRNFMRVAWEDQDIYVTMCDTQVPGCVSFNKEASRGGVPW